MWSSIAQSASSLDAHSTTSNFLPTPGSGSIPQGEGAGWLSGDLPEGLRREVTGFDGCCVLGVWEVTDPGLRVVLEDGLGPAGADQQTPLCWGEPRGNVLDPDLDPDTDLAAGGCVGHLM